MSELRIGIQFNSVSVMRASLRRCTCLTLQTLSTGLHQSIFMPVKPATVAEARAREFNLGMDQPQKRTVKKEDANFGLVGFFVTP